jgi:hypothetical protein
MQFHEHKIINVEHLIPYALNSRTHSDAQMAQLAFWHRARSNPQELSEASPNAVEAS